MLWGAWVAVASAAVPSGFAAAGGGATGCSGSCSSGEYCFFVDVSKGLAVCLDAGGYVPGGRPSCSSSCSAGCDQCFIVTQNGSCPGNCQCITTCAPQCPSGLSCMANTTYPKAGYCLTNSGGQWYIPSSARKVTTCDSCNVTYPEWCVQDGSNNNYCVSQCAP